MDSPETPEPVPEPTPGSYGTAHPGPPWQLVAFVAFASVVLLVGLIVWATSGGDQITLGTAPSTAAAPTTAPPPATAVADTSPTPMPSTSAPAPTTTEPAATTTTAPPAPAAGDAAWTVTLPQFPDDPVTLARAATSAGVTVFDGLISTDSWSLRCTVIVVAGRDGWQEACGDTGVAGALVAFDGAEPVVVQMGPLIGEVSIARQQPTWSLPGNGCREPVVALAAAAALAPAVVTGVVCVGDQAMMTLGPVLLQNGPADGVGLLLANGVEGWNLIDAGTALECGGYPDGVDRCAVFGTGLSEAVLPIPPIDLLTPATDATDVVEVADRTEPARSWAAGSADLVGVEAAIRLQLVDPAAQPPATVRVADRFRPGVAGLVVVELPAPDDSIRSTAWAIWVGDGGAILRATAWVTCARGVAGGVCV